jgi:hypothetical protein
MNKSNHIIITISTAITRFLAVCSEGSSELSPCCSSYSSDWNPQAQRAPWSTLRISGYTGYTPYTPKFAPQNMYRYYTGMGIEGRYTLCRYRPSLHMTHAARSYQSIKQVWNFDLLALFERNVTNVVDGNCLMHMQVATYQYAAERSCCNGWCCLRAITSCRHKPASLASCSERAYPNSCNKCLRAWLNCGVYESGVGKHYFRIYVYRHDGLMW